jgi:hypothetical protein
VTDEKKQEDECFQVECHMVCIVAERQS